MPFTLMPFLYQTRTILRVPTHGASARITRSFHATSCRPKQPLIPFDYEVGPPDEDAPFDEAASRGTITPTERQIFERIFADIEARGLKPAVKDGDAPAPDSAASRSARLIMQQAAYDVGQARPETVTAPGLLSGVATDRAKALLRFPPQLRRVAAKALDTVKHEASGRKLYDEGDEGGKDGEGDATAGSGDWKAPAHTFARTIELEVKRQPERTRVEGLIMSATSDFELWDILEKEVFTMPARLGIMKSPAQFDDTTPTDSTTAPLDGDGHNAEEGVEAAEVDATPTSSDDVANPADPANSHKLSLYVHGPLYPAYTLLALRRLDTAFRAPSPLVFSILPRIKELGLESYILGVSTPFFNELLNIYWTRRGDLTSVLNLLEEMRHCGLYFDTQTAAILSRVQRALSGLAKGETGNGFGKALMFMPEYERSQRDRIRHWHRAVDISARERQSDIEFAEAASKKSPGMHQPSRDPY